MERIIISAMTRKNHIIGKNNWLPWNIPEELNHFRKITENGIVIMGRKTYDSIGRPMPKRRNIIVSQSTDHIDKVEVAPTVEKALDMAKKANKPIFIIGGAQIYKYALDNKLVDKMYISYIKKEYDGDTTFPHFDEDEWEIEKREEHDEWDFVVYRKK